MNWKIKMTDPSGETRVLPLSLPLSAGGVVGRAPGNAVPLRDATVPDVFGHLKTRPVESGRSPFWLCTLTDEGGFTIGDLRIREAQIPAGLPFRIGETWLEILTDGPGTSLPEAPSSARPWLTASESGAQMLWMTRKAATTPLSIYLAGETGTGKEVLAHLIHAWSERASGPFVPLHCGALALSLVESELFGHVKGAFTGAIHQRPGALLQAHGGTLLLDEIADLPMDIQVKLLRFLENGEIRAVGSDHVSRSDARLICATHRPLAQLVDEGKFRRDLYYRLASITIEIPTLRSRPDDIELLANRFAAELKRRLSPMAFARLKTHPWPGNVRELRHAVERACALAGPFTAMLGEDAFDFLLDRRGPKLLATGQSSAGIEPVLSLAQMQRLMVLRALRVSKGNRTEAAHMLGIARSTLFEMLRRQKIVGPRHDEETARETLSS